MKLPGFTIIALLLATSALPVDSSSAGDFFFSHRQKTRTKTKLPKHNYSENVWPFTAPSTFGATAIAVAQTDPTDNGATVKPFHFRANDLTVNHLILDQVGLTLYKSGKLIASGRIYHSGGAGELIGNNVTVRIRAYVSHTAAEAPVVAVMPQAPLATDEESAGPETDGTEELTIPIASPNEVNRIPPDAYRVWSSERKFWVSRGRPQHVSLVDPVDRFEDQAVLRQHFDDITHLEVELEYQRDR